MTRQYKYIWYSQTGIEQFFDLEKDPQETHNAITDPEYECIIQSLRKTLIKELSNRPEGYSDGRQLIVGKTPVNMIKYRP